MLLTKVSVAASITVISTTCACFPLLLDDYCFLLLLPFVAAVVAAVVAAIVAAVVDVVVAIAVAFIVGFIVGFVVNHL